MPWLVYTRGLRAPSPRIIFDFDGVGNPILGEAERGNVLAKHRLTGDEAMLVRAAKLTIADLVKRYKPPPPPESRPVQPDPVPPAPTGGAAAKQLEAA